MLKMKKLLLLTPLIGGITLTSCISEEPLNMECDLLEVSLNIQEPTTVFFHDYDTVQSVISATDSVRFLAKAHSEIGMIPVSLRVTEGATAFHAEEQTPFINGTSLDFSDSQRQTFRIVSQDGKWERQYRVFIDKDKVSEGDMQFDFETYSLDSLGNYHIWSSAEQAEKIGKYYIWQADGNAKDIFPDGVWKNGNPGYKLSRSSAKPMEYPSTPVKGGGPDGSDCVKLETCDTGSFGAMVNMRIASGSFFNGNFDVSNALKDALKATQFSSPFKHKPLTVSAYLRFEPGSKFQDKKGNIVEGVIDEPDFYAVVYRASDAEGNATVIDGNNVLSSPEIVALARLPHHYNADGSDQLSNDPIHGVSNEWQKVTLQLEYREELDPVLLQNNGYKFCISMASSWQGAYFQGAVGSKLWIDKIEVICE